MMNIKQIEKHLSDKLALNVEVTIRSENEFTFSIDDGNKSHAEQIVKWFSQAKQPKKVEFVEDDELQMIFIYIET